MLLRAVLLYTTLAWASAQQYSPDIPHVDECFMCKKCHTGSAPQQRKLQAAADASTTGADDSDGGLLSQRSIADLVAAVGERFATRTGGGGAGGRSAGRSGWRVRRLQQDEQLVILEHQGEEGEEPGAHAGESMYVPPAFKFRVMPSEEEIAAKMKLKNCTECYGCSTQVDPLKSIVTPMLGQGLRTEVGASPEWLFFADLPETSSTGRKAVVKVWCMPIDKVHKTFSWRCTNTEDGAKAVQFLVAQQKVMEECGLMDVTIKVQPQPVNAVEPESGLHIWWDGLWMERANGVSLNQISYKRTKSFVTQVLTSMLGEKLNKTRVVRAAIYDLLSSQCDRHAQNVFMDDKGNLKLIDNLQALQFSWRHCAMDSIFLPGTQKNAMLRWGGSVIYKTANAKPRRTVNPMVVLDYRCYVKDGRIHKDYDPTLRACLTKLSGMTAKDVQREYGFPYLSGAEVLQQRASDMLNKGFEWTLRYGKPQNASPKRLRQGPPCCSLSVTKEFQIECGHPWSNEVEVPKGDPFTGDDWTRTYKDPGTYEGGTYVDWPLESDDDSKSTAGYA